MEEQSSLTSDSIVLIIHGTWNSPDESGTSTVPWYRLDDSCDKSFIQLLNNQLEAAGRGRPVSATLPGNKNGFAWSGGNTHEERLDAAEKLKIELSKLTSAGRTVHVIAHSHGGNVLLSAIQKMRDETRPKIRRAARRVWKDAVSKVEAGMEAGEAAAQALRADADARNYEVPDEVQESLEQSLRPTEPATQSRWKPLTGRRRSRQFRKIFVKKLSDIGIGRVVFLGTPFYYKKWTIGHFDGARRIDWLFRIAGALAVSIPFAIYFTYAVIVIYGGLLALTPWVTFPGWNPVGWPTWIKIAGSLLGIWSAWNFGAELFRNTGRSDGNLYDTVESNEEIAAPIEALVVHAGLMDEALLALSAEPLVASFLLPHLHEMLSPKLWRGVRPDATRVSASAGTVAQRIFRWGWVQCSNLVLLLLWPLRKGISWLLEHYTSGTILKLASTGGFGLPRAEFTNARIEASNILENLPQYRAAHWDVSRVLSAKAAPAAVVSKIQDRYSFLWDEEELERRCKDSFTWKQVQKRQKEVFKRMLVQGTERDIRRLKMTCAMVDARAREFAGAVELAHSTYCSNETVINGIASFLAGKTGPWQTGP